jgi:flagellar biosynthesis protein FlhG
MRQVRVISVTSGKGGVGKSHLAVNLASLCARSGRRVVLIDADGGLANADVLLGVRPVRHVGHLLEGEAPRSVLTPAGENLWLLAGAPGERRFAQLDDATRHVLTSAWHQLAEEFDVLVVDVAAGVHDDVLFFTSAGQSPFLVVTDEPTSIADAAVLLRALRLKTPVRVVDVVINGVRTGRSAQAVFARLQQAAEGCDLLLRFASHVPDDQNVRRAAMAGRPLVELAPTSPASRAFERLAQNLLVSAQRLPSGGAWLSEAQLSATGS